MNIEIAGLCCVGLSNTVLLAQHNEVVAIDIAADNFAMLNQKQSPIEDAEKNYCLCMPVMCPICSPMCLT